VAMVDAYCPAPKCPCKRVRLWLVDVTEASAPHPLRAERILAALERTWVDGSPSLDLELDLASRKLSWDAGANAGVEHRTLLDRVKECLLPFQIDALKEHRNRVRAWAKANPVDRDLWEKVEDLGSVDWCGIFPNGRPLLLGVHGGREYLLLDSYCANAGCTCEEVMISPCDERSGLWSAMGCLRVSLSPEVEPVRVTDATSPEVEAIFRSFLDNRPGALELFRKRKAMLRELGRLWVGEEQGALRPELAPPPATESPMAPAPTRPLSRAGLVPRNAPCPCGSGRKYKNCCGRVGVGP